MRIGSLELRDWIDMIADTSIILLLSLGTAGVFACSLHFALSTETSEKKPEVKTFSMIPSNITGCSCPFVDANGITYRVSASGEDPLQCHVDAIGTNSGDIIGAP